MKKTMTIELAHENPAEKSYYYATLNLPAKGYEIRDAYQRARLIGQENTYCEISIYNHPLSQELDSKRLDSPTIEELNFLAKRLAMLSEDEMLVLHAILPSVIKDDEIVSMKDLINCTYGLDTVMIAGGMTTDEQLGEFVIENELNDDVAAIPQNSMYLLDKARIGKLQRESENGVFLNGFYIIVDSYELPEIYDGETLPETDVEQWSAFRLKIAAPPKDDAKETADSAEWLSLPNSRYEADALARRHGMAKIEDCVYLDFESSMRQISEEQFGSMEDFDKLNSLAWKMIEMASEDEVLLKAVLEAEKPTDINEIMEMVENLSLYELCETSVCEGSFFSDYLKYHLGEQFDKEWLDTLRPQSAGKRLLEKLGATLTDYGVISAKGRSLYEFVPYSEENTQVEDSVVPNEEEDTQSEDFGMQMGGM